ncbi:NUDIX hydrolase [Microlunatus aurantiacus]|uniref:NUDIX hydrolase n=2 Tax=Microlunatus aurantiacus TaxID=446786 RepID=A0ABP7DB33_9ACTN
MDRMIKVKAFAVLADASRSRHLVWVSQDETKEPPTFHRLLGGHVEFGEGSAEAVVREIADELHHELGEVTLLGVLENVFTYAGAPGHEIVFVYAAVVADGTVPDEGGWYDDGGPIRVEWRPVDGQQEIPLYPDGTQALLDRWVAVPSARVRS